MDKRVLVIGATGLVGSALMRQLQGWMNITTLGTYYSQPTEDYAYLELENFHSIDRVVGEFHPNFIFVPGAATNVDRCETDASTYRVNVEAIQHIAELSKKLHYKIALYSTSYVFDGKTESPYTIYDTPMPINEYGVQKLLAERAVLAVNGLVIRTVGVFGIDETRKNFVYQMLDGATLGQHLDIVDDQFINPILSDDLARHSVQAMNAGLHGVIHLAGSECVSKYQFALDIAEVFDLPICYFHPVSSKFYNRKSLRPRNGCLASTMEPEHSYFESLEVLCEHL